MTFTELSAKDVCAIIACAKKANVKELEYKGLKVVYNLAEDPVLKNQLVQSSFNFEPSSQEAPEEIIPTNTPKHSDIEDLIFSDPVAYEESLFKAE